MTIEAATRLANQVAASIRTRLEAGELLLFSVFARPGSEPIDFSILHGAGLTPEAVRAILALLLTQLSEGEVTES